MSRPRGGNEERLQKNLKRGHADYGGEIAAGSV